jgi:hypothetical protein
MSAPPGAFTHQLKGVRSAFASSFRRLDPFHVNQSWRNIIENVENIPPVEGQRFDTSCYTTLEELRGGFVCFVGRVRGNKFLFWRSALRTKAAKKIRKERERLSRENGAKRRDLQRLELAGTTTPADVDAQEALIKEIQGISDHLLELYAEQSALDIPFWNPKSGKELDDDKPWLESDGAPDKRVLMTKEFMFEMFEDDWDALNTLVEDRDRVQVPKFTTSSS